MQLVAHRGTQYDLDNLPAHIDPNECVPLAEWLATAAKPKRTGAGAKLSDDTAKIVHPTPNPPRQKRRRR